MYAAVPRIIPACVIAGLVIVGEFASAFPAPGSRFPAAGSNAFASPKSSTFTVPSSRTLMFAGFRSRWMMPCSCAASSASAICARDRQRFVDWNRTARDALRQILAFDQLHHQRVRITAFLESVNVRDVRMVECGEGLRFAREPRQPIRIAGERVGQNFQRHVAIELRVPRAIDLSHAPGSQDGEDLVRAEACAGSESQLSWIIRG